MARERKPSKAPSAEPSRKRPADAILESTTTSPSKKVQFSKNLTAGPAHHESYPPTPRHARAKGSQDKDENDQAAAAQLLSEEEQAESAGAQTAKVRKVVKVHPATATSPKKRQAGTADGSARSARDDTANKTHAHSSAQAAETVKKLTPKELQKKHKEMDVKIAADLETLFKKIKLFAQKHFSVTVSSKPPTRPDVIKIFNDEACYEFVRFVGFLAVGGPNGKKSWEDLFIVTEHRQAVVVGIIGRALKEHVFNALCFGASDALAKELAQAEIDLKDGDGFYRQQDRAAKIAKWSAETDSSVREANRLKAVVQMRAKILILLNPILHLQSPKGVATSSRGHEALVAELHDIVEKAASLARQMREQGDVIFHFPPVFKDESFQPKRMMCFNVETMRSTCPYPTYDKKGVKVEAANDRGDPSAEALVKVLCSSGCVSYRRGGGQFAKDLLATEQNARAKGKEPHPNRRRPEGEVDDVDMGFREKVLSKGEVCLRWGHPMSGGVRKEEKKEGDDDDVQLLDITRWKKPGQEKSALKQVAVNGEKAIKAVKRMLGSEPSG
ncbi:hypothetical protein LTR28_008491 [Elasticomyces elasticus]|nr:hypothetical protein LTR28_008491 [Elasticomyces elasticus]